MNPTSYILVGSAVVAAMLAYGSTWLARTFAPRLGFMDQPDGGRKQHGKATPLLGGVAIFFAFGVTVVAFLALTPQEWLSGDPSNLSFLLISSGLFCMVGLWDDRSPLRARDKFLLQVLASLPYAIYGQHVWELNLIGFSLYLGPWAWVFSVFWLVSCANVINLVDGLDGLAGCVGLIAMATIAAVAFGSHDAVVAFVALTFAGSIAGFLIHNWPPARIFLGDAGSLTIGFMIGAIAIESASKTTAGFVLIFPLALLSVPIFDTSMAILRRKLTGRGIGQPDRGHIHHRLQDRGFSKLQALLAITGTCFTVAVSYLLAVYFEQHLITVAACVGVVTLVVAGRIFGFHELMLVFRHLDEIRATVSKATRDLSMRQIVIHLENDESVSQDILWESICEHVQRIGGSTLEMNCCSRFNDRSIFSQHWSRQATDPQIPGAWEIQFSFPRADGLITTFSVLGHESQEAKHRSFDLLIQFFEACCHQLPSIDELQTLSMVQQTSTQPALTSKETGSNNQRRAA